jgi:hypothetical protein
MGRRKKAAGPGPGAPARLRGLPVPRGPKLAFRVGRTAKGLPGLAFPYRGGELTVELSHEAAADIAIQLLSMAIEDEGVKVAIQHGKARQMVDTILFGPADGGGSAAPPPL